MKNNKKLIKEISIKNHFDDIIKIENFDFDILLLYWKSYGNNVVR